MSTSPAYGEPWASEDDVADASNAELLAAILAELRLLNATIIPLADAAQKRFPFSFGFGK